MEQAEAMSGKFDAAIRILGDSAVSFHATAERVRKDGALSSDYRSAERDIDDAIRVLEAAGKVRPDDSCWMASAVDAKQSYEREVIGHDSEEVDGAWKRVVALLYALPDEAASRKVKEEGR
jgi:hypothetical protein